MRRTLSLAFVLLAVVAFAGWLLVDSVGRAHADGVYNPSNTEHSNGPYYIGPCNDGIDNDYDGLIDAADPDCLDPKPLPTSTGAPTLPNTPTPPNSPTPPNTSTPPNPSATPTPHLPSLGGVAKYPDLPSGGSAVAIAAIAVAMASLVSGGAGWHAWRRRGR